LKIEAPEILNAIISRQTHFVNGKLSVVAGDYDGDAKADLAVFRPSGAVWFIERTTQGTLIQGFGAASDIPIPSAFVPWPKS
jgi:hypothetical protein